MKKQGGKSETKKEKQDKDKKTRKTDKAKALRREEEEEDGPEWEVVNRGAIAERPVMFNKDQEINAVVVMKKLAEITAVRGKKVRIVDNVALVLLLTKTHFMQYSDFSTVSSRCKDRSAKINIINGYSEI